MQKIVFVHGIGMGGRAERAGFSEPLQKLLYENPKEFCVEAIWEDVNDGIDKLIGGIVEELGGPIKWPGWPKDGGWLRNAGKILVYFGCLLTKQGIKEGTDLLLDLPLYLGEPHGSRIRKRIRVAVEQNPGCILVGHSLGSLIAYDVLCELRANGELPVTHFITFGSPLQWVKEIQWEGTDVIPVSLGIPWDNVYYTTDPVCLKKKLDDKVFSGVTNHSLEYEKSKFGIFAHTAYWEDQRVADVIKGALN